MENTEGQRATASAVMKTAIKGWARENKVTLNKLTVTSSTVLVRMVKHNRWDGGMAEYIGLKKLIGWGRGDVRNHARFVEFFFERKG